MQLTIMQEALKDGLATVKAAVAGKSPIPVLTHILLATDGQALRLAATNLEIGITHQLPAEVAAQGAVAIPAKLLTDVVGGLPNDRVTLTLAAHTQTLTVACGRFKNNIKGLDADEFPPIPTLADAAPTAAIPADVLREAIGQVAFAAASDDARPVLAGVLLRLQDSQLFMAAADGVRLATRTVVLPAPVTRPVEVIVPARALAELGRIAGEVQGSVAMTVASGGGQVRFHTAHTTLVARLIDGRFPDVERIIPQRHTTRAVLETAELAKAVKLASYFAATSQHVVKLTLEPGGDLGPGRLVISANAVEVGDNTGELDGTIHGEGGQIALNVAFMAEWLSAVKTPQVAFETVSHLSPAVLKPIGVEGSTHVIMPMSLQ
jgi:DNA polymerase-3 subunit beta